MVMLLLVIARVLYTRYCAVELSTRIFASIQRLARALHIVLSGHVISDCSGARSPHRKRVATVRHEFQPQYHVAHATYTSGACRSVERVSASPSLIAIMRGAGVRSAGLLNRHSSLFTLLGALVPFVSVAQRELARTATTLFVPFVRPHHSVVAPQRTPDCVCLMEAA